MDAAGLTSEPALAVIPFTDFTIGGRLFHDVNGVENNTIDGDPISSAGQSPCMQTLCPLQPGGSRQCTRRERSLLFGTRNGLQANTSFFVVISTLEGIAGTSIGATPLLPAGWQNTAEGSGTGDGIPNGAFELNTASETTPEISFGIQMPPVAYPVTALTQVNPGGSKRLPVPALNGLDPEDGVLDGTVQPGTPGNRVRITSFPSNATLYYQDVALDTATALITNYDATRLFVDPDHGAMTITFTYREVDQGGLASDDALVTMPVTDLFVSGSVYQDANGTTDNLLNGIRISQAGSASPLFVNLVNTAGQVVGSVPVNAGTFELGTAAGLESETDFTLVLSATEGIAGTDTGAGSELPAEWANTADGAGTGDSNADGVLAFTMGSETVESGFDFGIEQLPTAGSGSHEMRNEPGDILIKIPADAFSNDIASSDPDGDVSSLRITSFPAGLAAISINGTSYRSNVPEEAESLTALLLPTDQSGNPSASMAIDPGLTTETRIDIPFEVVDNAGKASTNTGHAVFVLTAPLPVTLISFDAVKEGSTALLTWATSEESNSQSFEIQHSADGITWAKAGQVAAAGNSTQIKEYRFVHAQPLAGNNYYRLKMTDADASFAFSRIRTVAFGHAGEISIYPNPARDIASIQLENWQQVSRITIIDSRSNEMLRLEHPQTNTIDLRSYTPGVYLVRVEHNNGIVITRKVVVIR
ncbi:T9SS type A sorting domain-containing protein [Dyadobacter sandarakinus]|uniref:T9SS type A sorting domain-containing protein n=1 Tax=Dyadobacter sandarakinus TaxID=2747268 RepID=A0ABX7I2A3_9BACT|nr:T9SS type A sorting domain-containing protein [Dyadobacter sandarakinus]QRR00065.1 T9SS type A sorting domain-containing protein [Dyadobacter sandarakinus]